MLVVELSYLYKIFVSLSIGFLIKLMDDYVDGDNEYSDKKTLVKLLGRSIMPYSMILLVITTSLHVEYAVTLMSACYIVGMFQEIHLKLISGLKSYHESILILLINSFIFSFKAIITSIILILIIQLFDDIRDMEWDKRYGFKNFANHFGKGEIIIIICILLISGLMLDITKLFIVIPSAIAIESLYNRINDKIS